MIDEICPKCGKANCYKFRGFFECRSCGNRFTKEVNEDINIDKHLSSCENLILSLKATSVNLRTLHRNLESGDWFEIHELLGEYYDKIDEFEDSIVENLMSLGFKDVSLAKACDNIIEPKSFNEKEALTITKQMFDYILELSKIVRKEINLPSSVAPAFDELENYLQIESNYKIKKYLM